MKILSTIKALISTFFMFVVLVIGVLIYVSGKGDFYGWRMLIVQSGSMEPSISTGSVIFTKKTDQYISKDVVTFETNSADKILVTHRIVEVLDKDDKKLIRTKGDANQIEDKDLTAYEKIIGKYVFGVPYLGFVIDFAKTPVGVVILVIVPGTIIIYDELLNIKKHLWLLITNRKNKDELSSYSNDSDDVA